MLVKKSLQSLTGKLLFTIGTLMIIEALSSGFFFSGIRKENCFRTL